ncbi:MAG: helix-turn-helix transcriptional regulator [Thermodesulfovibrionia bacterium]|nr:helix-turn-helix transcriptional regulator [Thermodesulfovibrionia bacterium]
MSDIKKIFGKNIRLIRESMNMTQEKLSDLCGLHRTYIGSVERGERNISLENISKIARALNVKISDLFNEINEKKKK